MSDDARPKRDYKAQKDYVARLKQQGVVRHMVIVDGGVRDAFVGLSTTMKASQGDLLAALIRLANAHDSELAMLIEPRRLSAERQALKAHQRAMRDAIRRMSAEELERVLAKLHEGATSPL